MGDNNKTTDQTQHTGAGTNGAGQSAGTALAEQPGQAGAKGAVSEAHGATGPALCQ